MKLAAYIFTIALLYTCNTPEPSIIAEEPETPSKTACYILLGQSNATGWANPDKIDQIVRKEFYTISDEYNYFSNNDISTIKYRPLKRPVEFPIFRNLMDDFGIEGDSTLGVPFSIISYLHDNKHPITLIEFSRGATSLYGAWNSEWTLEKSERVNEIDTSYHDLFEKSQIFVKDKLEYLQTKNTIAELKAIVWIQGENDAYYGTAANHYKENLKNFITNYRTRLNQEELPFLIVQTNSTNNQHLQKIRNAQVAMSNELENIILIPTSIDTPSLDYPKHFDHLHYNYEGIQKLGSKIGEELKKLN